MDSSIHGIGLVQLVDCDPRPTFIAALSPPGGSPARDIAYRNVALEIDTTLLASILQIPHHETHAPFWTWVTTPKDPDHVIHGPGDRLSYLGVWWTRSIIRGLWAVVNANDTPPPTEPPRRNRSLEAIYEVGIAADSLHPGAADENHASEKPTDADDEKFHVEPDPGLMLPDFGTDTEPFLHVIQSVNWEEHALGPIDDWPVRLHQAFNQTIPDSRAIAIYWGPEYRAIYNESFSRICGSNHPGLLGESVLKAWPQLEESLDTLWRAPPHLRPKKIEDESRFFVQKADGTCEETYIRWSLSPIVENRKCVGMTHSLLDTTSMRLWERRMKMLVDLGDNLITARDVNSYWTMILQQLERWSPSYDVPLAFIYSVNEDDDTASSGSRYDCPRTCRLAGSLGVPPNHPLAPPTLDLGDTDQGLASRFREALKTQVALLIQTKDGGLPEELFGGLQWRGFGDPCQAAVILPIRPTKDENIMGVLFLGLNPRRPYDNDYRQFISLLNQKLTSSLASTVLLEEEARRGRNAAAQAEYDTAMLQKKLAFQTEQANQSIQNFKAVAEFIPVGMSFIDNQGNVTFANDAWYRLTGYPMSRIDQLALLECVLPEDKPKVQEAYEKLKVQDVVTFEFRIPRENIEGDGRAARSSVPGSGTAYDPRVGRHILASSKAERETDGSIARMLTCLMDVTKQKDTAEEAVRRAQEAENLKRLAEFATVGMYDISLDGRVLSANKSFWDLSGLDKVDLTTAIVEPFQTSVVEEDLPMLLAKLEELKQTRKPQSAEIRLKTTWTAEDSAGNTIAAARSVLATFMPVTSSDGVLQSFTGCISDVSLQKWQLERERRRKEEAIESKRQQENFIDMTSHEMRNPLSAIIHCTDAIIASLSMIGDMASTGIRPKAPMPLTELAAGSGTERPETPQTRWQSMSDELLELRRTRLAARKLIRDAIDHAETIETCAQHQKRIVDDILTMSKLDSKLLAVTPCTVNPITIVQDALKMFEVEARRVDIALTWEVDESYTALGHEYLDFDPSRVKQVLINLLTNALKFTKSGKVRNVGISIKGSRHPPGRDLAAVDFIPRFMDLADEYEQPALKDRKDPVYLLFEVTDTGQGLSPEEKGSLFNKFVQASAKTHVKYGGSGLGLFISRRLTELQHGAIGVSSQQGVGSTFAFYIGAYVPSDRARVEAEEAAQAALQVHNGLHGGGSGSPGGPGSHPSSPTSANGRLSMDGSADGTRSGGYPAVPRVDGILIVEDNLINQHITRRGLAGRGYAVDVANHGIEALEKLQRPTTATATATSTVTIDGTSDANGEQHHPERRIATTQDAADASSTPSAEGEDDDDERKSSTSSSAEHKDPVPINLVLMDVEMPVQDGLTCTRQIRNLEAHGAVFCASGGRLPIIAVTANARPEQVSEAKLAGCDDVLVKPYRIPELIDKMQTVTRRLKEQGF
ncbi:Signal transduction histidine kinase [Geosmithia morbida]|uniref:Signal transduction histidine kinase n=1 Tax=Geosmithia morbida TaxID=1094350 RepID=A0A9P4YYE0_9HYPO|nr:Signal transduction histidine kinase [Geosmithia morbida]KAF4124782.1 Signal transduction histidine kinase [Geosmithia morbida]